VKRDLSFKANTLKVEEHQTDRRLEGFLSELFFECSPLAIEGIEGFTEVVFIEGFLLWQAAGRSQQRASCMALEGVL
jgi:hypothetical protein